MSIEANKAIVRMYIELWSTGNLALADEVLAADFVDHTHPNQAPGPESVKQEIKAFRDGFPDARITVEQMIGEGDTVAFRCGFVVHFSTGISHFTFTSQFFSDSPLDKKPIYQV